MTRPYAEDTSVPVARSRAEIAELLHRQRCISIQWTDDIEQGVVTLRFRWRWEEGEYQARIGLQLPTEAQLRRERPKATEAQRQRHIEQRTRSLHRVLALTIRAQVHAVEAGLVTAVEIFLPWLEDSEGRTVAEFFVPRLRLLPTTATARLLGGS